MGIGEGSSPSLCHCELQQERGNPDVYRTSLVPKFNGIAASLDDSFLATTNSTYTDLSAYRSTALRLSPTMYL